LVATDDDLVRNQEVAGSIPVVSIHFHWRGAPTALPEGDWIERPTILADRAFR
jgi:hypothetical protein